MGFTAQLQAQQFNKSSCFCIDGIHRECRFDFCDPKNVYELILEVIRNSWNVYWHTSLWLHFFVNCCELRRHFSSWSRVCFVFNCLVWFGNPNIHRLVIGLIVQLFQIAVLFSRPNRQPIQSKVYRLIDAMSSYTSINQTCICQYAIPKPEHVCGIWSSIPSFLSFQLSPNL